MVQDLPHVVETAMANISAHDPGRVEFRAHDFFTPQPITADAYLFRWVLHDWPDAYVVRILQQLTSAIPKGAKIIVNESLCPELGSLPLSVERHIWYERCISCILIRCS